MKGTKVRLGIVGAGIASRELHLPALRKLEDIFTISAVTSRTRKKAEEFSNLVGNDPEVFDTFEEMLRSGAVDAVALAVPIALNPVMIKSAVEASIPVICEKPLAPSTSSALNLLNLPTDVPVYIAENYRHIEVYRKAAELVKEGAIGDPLIFNWRKWVDFGIENKYVQTKWRRDPSHVGGFISDGGVHDVAALRMILGEVLQISGFSKQSHDYTGAEDTIVFNMKLENGTLGNYSVFYGSPIAKNRLEIVGSKEALTIDKAMATLNISGKYKEEFLVNKTEGFIEEFRDFYRVLNGQANKLGNVHEAFKDLATVEAGLVSARENRIITVKAFIDNEGSKK